MEFSSSDQVIPINSHNKNKDQSLLLGIYTFSPSLILQEPALGFCVALVNNAAVKPR